MQVSFITSFFFGYLKQTKQKHKCKCKYKSFITFFFFEYVINRCVKPRVNKTVEAAKEKKIDNNHWSRNKTCLKKTTFNDEKNEYYCLLWIFQPKISLHALKLKLTKSMHTSDNEQGISKLWPYFFFVSFENYHNAYYNVGTKFTLFLSYLETFRFYFFRK